MKKIFWVGNRESDIFNESIFFGSITLYGTGTNNNYAYPRSREEHSQSDYYNFIKETIYFLLEKYNFLCYFLFSNPKIAYLMPNDIQNQIICLNEYIKIIALNDKIFQRQYLSEVCNMPPFIILNGILIKDIKFITTVFNNKYDEFIVQNPFDSGGKSTYLLSNKTTIEILDNEVYLVTPFYENNIPLNVHCLITNDDIIIFPPSIQIINKNFNYIGTDFIGAQNLSKEIKTKIYNASKDICSSLIKLKVKGLFGIDFLLINNELIFLEINFRIQGSTFLLNYGLRDIGLSIFEMLIYGFYGKKHIKLKNIFEYKINYSFHRLNDKNSLCPPIKPFKINYDGYNSKKNNFDKYYKYSIIYKESILIFFN